MHERNYLTPVHGCRRSGKDLERTPGTLKDQVAPLLLRGEAKQFHDRVQRHQAVTRPGKDGDLADGFAVTEQLPPFLRREGAAGKGQEQDRCHKDRG